MQIQQAVAWVDHREARIFLLDRQGFERVTVSTQFANHHQTYNKAGTIDGKRVAQTSHTTRRSSPRSSLQRSR